MTTEDIFNKPFSSYKSMSSTRNICLPPRYLGNVAQGIRDQLDSEINLYCPELESVVISYENLKLCQAVSSILDDSPYLHFRVQADYIFFKPTIGCILKGVVNKVSKDHVGCLVHNCFNASIHRPRQNLNGWRGAELQQGEEFPFEVLNIYSNNSVVSLKGKLVDQKVIEAYLKSLKLDDGNQTTEDCSSVFVESGGEITLDNEPVVKKKRGRTSLSETVDESHDRINETVCASHDRIDGNDEQLSSSKKKKKKKDTRRGDSQAVKESENGDPHLPSGKKRKHSVDFSPLDKSSAKNVRFDSTVIQDSSPDFRKSKNKLQLSPLYSGNDESEFDSSVSKSLKSKKRKKKKKHKTDFIESEDEELGMTRLKSKAVPSGDDEYVRRKKGKNSLMFSSNSEFCEIFNKIPSEKSKKKKSGQKDLLDVVSALQSEVTRTASKIMSPSPSKKTKQKKKKHRDSSSSPSNKDQIPALSDSVSPRRKPHVQLDTEDSKIGRKRKHSLNVSDLTEDLTRRRKKKKMTF